MTNLYANTNRTNSITRIVAAIIMGVLVFSLTACGAARPKTLQVVLEQDPSAQKGLQGAAKEYANGVAQATGLNCKASVNCVDNQLSLVAYFQLTEEQLIAEGITGLFTGQFNTWQELASQILTYSLDGEAAVQTIYSLEQEYGLTGITVSYALCDANGNVLGQAVYNDQGRIQ